MINYNYISLYQFQYLFNNEILIVEDHCSVTICSKQASSKKKMALHKTSNSEPYTSNTHA